MTEHVYADPAELAEQTEINLRGFRNLRNGERVWSYGEIEVAGGVRVTQLNPDEYKKNEGGLPFSLKDFGGMKRQAVTIISIDSLPGSMHKNQAVSLGFEFRLPVDGNNQIEFRPVEIAELYREVRLARKVFLDQGTADETAKKKVNDNLRKYLVRCGLPEEIELDFPDTKELVAVRLNLPVSLHAGSEDLDAERIEIHFLPDQGDFSKSDNHTYPIAFILPHGSEGTMVVVGELDRKTRRYRTETRIDLPAAKPANPYSRI